MMTWAKGYNHFFGCIFTNWRGRIILPKKGFYLYARRAFVNRTCKKEHKGLVIKRNNKFWETKSGLFFQMPNKRVFRVFLQYFLKAFNAKFRILKAKYIIYLLNNFSKKIRYLLLKYCKIFSNTEKKNTRSLLYFIVFWQNFLICFFDVFLKNDFSSSLFSVETKRQCKLFVKLHRQRWIKNNRHNLKKILVKSNDKTKTFSGFLTANDRLKYLISSFNLSKQLNYKRLKFNGIKKQRHFKNRYSNRRRYSKQKKNVMFKWVVLANQFRLRRKSKNFNYENAKISDKAKMRNYSRHMLFNRGLRGFSSIETGFNLVAQKRKNSMNFAANHVIMVKITTTNIYLTILSGRSITVAKFSIGLAGFRKKKIKKQNYVLKKLNSIFICFLLRYNYKWQTKFGEMPRFRVVIRSGFANKRLKILLNNFFYFSKKRAAIVRSNLYFKRKGIINFSKRYIKTFKKKYRFFNFGLTHYTADIYLNKFGFNKQHFTSKLAANKYINFIKLASGFNKLIYYFRRKKVLASIERELSGKNRGQKLSQYAKKVLSFKNKQPNPRTFNARRSRLWTNINLFFYLYFLHGSFSVSTNCRKLDTIAFVKPKSSLKTDKICGKKFELQLPPTKMWYDFSQEMWESVARNQLRTNKRNKKK